jgi:hypothetical protein
VGSHPAPSSNAQRPFELSRRFRRIRDPAARVASQIEAKE